MKQKYLILVFFLLSATLSLMAFGLNLGIDYQNSNLYILQTDNEKFNAESLGEIYQLGGIKKVEELDSNIVYAYLSTTTDNSTIVSLAGKYGASIEGNMEFEYSMIEYWQIENRVILFAVFSIVLLGAYYAAELKGIGFKRWQVAYYLFVDLSFMFINLILILGLASVLGVFGVVFDETFASFVALAMASGFIYRLYELQLTNRNGKLSYIERNVLLLLTTAMIFIFFMPFFVVWGSMSFKALVVMSSIIFNAIVALKFKESFVAYFFKSDMNVKFLTNKHFQKIW